MILFIFQDIERSIRRMVFSEGSGRNRFKHTSGVKGMAAFSVETARKRAEMMAMVRSFFAERGVLEVETPSLCSGVAPDCHIDLFDTDFQAVPGNRTEKRYLLSSPELPMKRLLAAGFPDIFQISRVYRNGEVGRLHNPEFTMLEWYRRGFDMYRLIDEVIAFLSHLLPEQRVEMVSYQEIFKRHTGIDPFDTTPGTVEVMLGHDTENVPAFTSLTDALIYAMAMKVEPLFDKQVLTVVYNYPKDQAVLSVVDPDDCRAARRFEVYCKGMELANGFEELTDTSENRRRFEAENEHRATEGKVGLPIDSRFLTDLKLGMPQCAGVAIGMDRVLMGMLDVKSIDEVISFGWDRS